MKYHDYVLTIQNKDIFKEINVSLDTPTLKIGTKQDSDVRLKREMFSVSIGVTLHFEADSWFLSCSDGLLLSTSAGELKTSIEIVPGGIYDLLSKSDNGTLFTILFSYNFLLELPTFDTILDIRKQDIVILGNNPKAHVVLDGPLIGSEYLILRRGKNGLYSLDATYALKSATLNEVRVFEHSEIQDYDFIGIANYRFYFKNQVLYTAISENMKIRGIPSQPLRDETPAFTYPKLNRSPRLLYQFNKKDIEILNPPNKPKKPQENLIMQLAPVLMTMLVLVVVRGGMLGGSGTTNLQFLIFSLSTMTIGLVTSIFSFVQNKKDYKKDLKEWQVDYENYIEKKRLEIEEAQLAELTALQDLYPNAEQSRDLVKTFSGRLFERSPKDDDFLDLRLGSGKLQAFRQVTFRQEQHIKIQNELVEIPETLSSEYKYLKNAPIMLHLKDAGTVGVVGTGSQQYEFLKNLVLDLSVNHSNEDVQIVSLLPQNDWHKYDWLKWFPHIKESGGIQRGIACDEESGDHILEYLYALMISREAALASGSKSFLAPHFVIFVLEEYGIKTHPLSKYAEKATELGMSFIYFKEYKEKLPQYCEQIIELTSNGGTLVARRDKSSTKEFLRDQVADESIRFVAERLAPVYFEKISLSSRLTANISLFEILNIITPEDLDLLQRWSRSNVQKTLKAPLGIDAKGQTVFLDLHEKSHGPHGLVAGTTGSGKSEILQSYVLSAASYFHPYEVSFVIIDFKGGGMANQFENLPHLIGKITDIDSGEIERSLLSIRAELEKRKKLFAEFEVNHIDQYISKFRAKEAKIALPHLILIVDEFAELKAEQPEFMKELVSTARVGRSLGIHLILATQKPSGQVSEQIWSNSRFRLCLKVATGEDSNEMIRTPLASEIVEPGRAYLQVGNNEIFTLFQSAYSGASAISDDSGSTREFTISQVSFTGKRTVIYEKKSKRGEDGSKITQLKAMVDYINKYCEKMNIARLSPICLPPLPDLLDYPLEKTDDLSVSKIPIGVYDDPSNQAQPLVNLDLAASNIMILGSAQTGKTMLLQTIIRNLAENYSPHAINLYVLDFASKMLRVYESLNHIGGVITDEEEENLKNFLKMINAEMAERKDRFSKLGIGSYDAYLETTKLTDLPRIVIMIDNLPVFREIFEEHEETLLNICREGLALGITVIATSKQTSGLSYKYLGNFATRIAFTCANSSEYINIFDRCRIQPKNIEGRGLVAINKVIYEFQAYLAFDGIVDPRDAEIRRSEARRTEQIRSFIGTINRKYRTKKARAIPSIPQILRKTYWDENSYVFDDYKLPLGLTFGEIEPVVLDLVRTGTLGIYGREQEERKNLLRLIMNYLQARVFDLPCEMYIVDGYDRFLAEFESYGFVEQYSVVLMDFEEIVEEFLIRADERLNLLRLGESLEDEPLLICLVENQQIFAANKISVNPRFKELVDNAAQLKICIIFSNVVNNGDYSPPEMLRFARDFSQFFLLDDLANVKLFGTTKFSVAELRLFKKEILANEGYLYSSSRGLEKIKLVNCEGGS